jgi:hypothetical protein
MIVNRFSPYNGRDPAGYIFETDAGEHQAIIADDEWLGSFASRVQASKAIAGQAMPPSVEAMARLSGAASHIFINGDDIGTHVFRNGFDVAALARKPMSICAGCSDMAKCSTWPAPPYMTGR